MALREPIAIVGIGCRLPGKVSNPESFWRLLYNGVDAISEVPPDRWRWQSFYHSEPGTPGKLYVRRGGFIEGVDLFDAPFFNISRREASWADPQQRQLLEVSYEALEDAGLSLDAIAGTRAAVYVGISTYDYGAMHGRTHERLELDAYTSLGSALCVTANRISYFFDLHGPSLAVDTACSSSLVATHLACQSIWNHEASIALVGGVNVLLQPDGTIGFCQARMLAADGQCKSFDASADGYVRAEGAAVVVLKPLSQALRDEDRIYSLIRGTAVNQDGRTTGITVPSEAAQTAMLQDVYRQADIVPQDVQYVEAHGTGTAVGDPIELHAIGKALGIGRSQDDPCLVGSVKSNLGHPEAASGVVGLIKAALCVFHGQIPPSLHYRNPNPNIPFEELKLQVVRELRSWPKNGHEFRVAGVNSFGFGGTNAHVVLTSQQVESAQHVAPRGSNGRALLVPLSARSSAAVKAAAHSQAAYFADPLRASVELNDIAHTAALRRTHHEFRTTVVAHSVAEFVESARTWADDSAPVESVAPDAAGQLAFVFSGMGPQWWGMGRQLFETEPVFRKTLEQCDAALRTHVSWSLLDELGKDETRSRINETYIAQPAIFAIQMGLSRLWNSWGIRPSAVIGHSLGEVAAACCAEVLNFEDAVALIYHRSRLQQLTSGEGRMLSVAMPFAEIEALVADSDGLVSIAAYNSPESVTISGDATALQQISEGLTAREIFNRFLKVDVPYHSRAMDRLEYELQASLRTLSPRPAAITLISTVTGGKVRGEEMNAEYWWRSMRYPVRFREAIATAARNGHRMSLEISPHPVMSASISESAPGTRVFSSLRRNEPERETMLKSAGQLYSCGFSLNWKAVNGDAGQFISMPRYPWQHERYWHESERGAQERMGIQLYPFLGAKCDSTHSTWVTDLNHHCLDFLDDHQVEQNVVFPAAAYLEMALEAACELFGRPPYEIEGLTFEKVMLLPRDGRPIVQLAFGERASEFGIFSRARTTNGSWERHVVGKLYRNSDSARPGSRPLAAIRERCTSAISSADCYRLFDARGLRYGTQFRGIRSLWAGKDEAFARIELDWMRNDFAHEFLAYPGIVDSAFQVLMGVLLNETDSGRIRDGLFLPSRIAKIIYHGPPPSRLWCHARLISLTEQRLIGDIELMDDQGNVAMEIRGFHCQHVERSETALSGGLGQFRWERDPAKRTSSIRRADDLLTPSAIVTKLKAVGGVDGWRSLGSSATQSIELAEAVRAYAFEAFAKMGWRPSVGERFADEELGKRLGVVGQHDRLFRRILVSLASEGFLREKDGEWTVVRDFHAAPSHILWKRLWDQFPSETAELMLIRRCGESLDRVLRGEIDGLDLIFSGGSSTTAEHLYQDSPSYFQCNRIVQKAVAAIVQGLPEGRTLRILEIGGGTGGMTAHLLPELPVRRAKYVFTDVGRTLLSQAEQRFGRFANIEFATLDIEKNPIDQGFEAHSFDLVLASDVFHATADLRGTLENVKRLLASRGLLIVLEGKLAPTPLWCTLIFGLLKGWWLFTDTDLRGLDPWISAEAWQNLLTTSGFDEATDLTQKLGTDEAVHMVVAGRGPAVPDRETPDAARSPETNLGAWLVFSDERGVAADLCQRLRGAAHEVVCVVRTDSGRISENGTLRARGVAKEDIRSALDLATKSGLGLRGIVHLWALDLPSVREAESTVLHAARSDVLASVMHLIQCLGETDPTPPPRIVLVTKGAESVGTSRVQVEVMQSPLWGLGRVAMVEYPQFRCRLVDLEPGEWNVAGSGQLADELFAEVLDDGAEEEVAWRGGVRHVHRFQRISMEELPPTEWPISKCRSPIERRVNSPQLSIENRKSEISHRSYTVARPAGGSLDNLRLHSTERIAPQAGQVEIEVRACGLNFKDVMLAMGLLPEDALEGGFTGRTLGMECTGKIVAVGEGVREFRVGDEVIACGPGTLRSHLTLNVMYVARMPQGISFEDGATVLIAYLTAWYGLVKLARLQRGERVLIHAATGGVGLAAVQLAQHIGAEIFATAGTEEKRDLLKALGVPHIFNSRTLSFADEILKHTDGIGVDVVLNSLSGDAIPKSLAILRPYGRFVEIGKRDVYEDSKVGLRPFRHNLSLFVLDMDRLCAQRPDAAGEAFREVMKLLADKTLRPLPHRVFPVDRIQDAFRYMAQARHIGKVVVSLKDQPISVAQPPLTSIRFHSDCSYLVTGGLGGFGLALARWLIDHGARHVALMSRRHDVSDCLQSALSAMREEGVEVRVLRGNVSDARDVGEVLAEISRSMPPLRGIFHAAMVLDDAPIRDLTVERFNIAMAPKADGAWNLHRLTQDLPLDHFVLFSSMASQIGNAGQANYVAANSFLDALAGHRNALNLPALTVNWGALSDVGYVAENPGIAKRLEANGVRPMPVRQMLSTLGVLMQRRAVQVGAGLVDWTKLAHTLGLTKSPRFAHLVTQGIATEIEGSGFDREAILRADPSERLEILQNYLREQLARVLGTTQSRLDVNQSIMNLGMDSLMAVEMRNRIRTALDVDIPPTKFMEGISLRGMAAFVLDRLSELHASSFRNRPDGMKTAEAPVKLIHPENAKAAHTDAVQLRAIGDLSDQEVNDQLQRLLAEAKK
ncbi:MAG: SDR family NAD(P)-dependent oxidoreductase [Planctomycetes bacterium]|nr:SDR family NAD(P)-dependent oxidoreductase [Planctomycetota bacterium]